MNTKMAAHTRQAGRTASTAGDVLVGRRWLAARLCDPRVRVIEVDVSPAAYNDWHIHGAVLWNVYADLKDGSYRTVDAAAFQRLVERSGIGPDSTVVFYGYAPALACWLMKLYGHPDVRILDCSRETWQSEGEPRSTMVSEPAPGTFRLASPDASIRADLAATRDAIGQPGSALLDVRTQAEYRGECFWPSGGMEPGGRAGRIPSAAHQPIDDIYNADGSFRSAAELRRVLQAADPDGSGELITYCTVGGRAATAWFVLTYLLGRDRVRVYDGSWADWGRTPGTPVERG